MDAWLNAVETTDIARHLRFSRWSYAAVNAAHIFGIAMLVGSVIPMNLRLLGVWPTIPRPYFLRALVPMAVLGLATAIGTGSLLFSVRAGEYADLYVFWAKLTLILLAAVSAIWAHLEFGIALEGASRGRLAFHALISIFCWTGALTCGRLIAFFS